MSFVFRIHFSLQCIYMVYDPGSMHCSKNPYARCTDQCFYHVEFSYTVGRKSVSQLLEPK